MTDNRPIQFSDSIYDVFSLSGNELCYDGSIAIKEQSIVKTIEDFYDDLFGDVPKSVRI